mmetsp:Transcript_33174/g.82560  ORF Transcript_33174/g.82560 Transcript_33174/m.82560 type:complete len:161 (-) Transcript_33174:7-489(-)
MEAVPGSRRAAAAPSQGGAGPEPTPAEWGASPAWAPATQAQDDEPVAAEWGVAPLWTLEIDRVARPFMASSETHVAYLEQKLARVQAAPEPPRPRQQSLLVRELEERGRREDPVAFGRHLAASKPGEEDEMIAPLMGEDAPELSEVWVSFTYPLPPPPHP